MNRADISAFVRSETEYIAYSIRNDFLPIKVSAPDGSDRFGFIHILMNIAVRNNTIISKMKNAILTRNKAEITQEYHPGLMERILLNHFVSPWYQKHTLPETDQHLFMAVCNEILSQQRIIRDLDACSPDVEITGTKISCCLRGLIKISIPGMLYRLIIQQKIQFMSALHMMLVSQLQNDEISLP